ncbi:hypothetical protein B1964_07660 [Gordonia sp. i37]|nr:hypothetical protein B1964_07660 [Gordonia sp. i37]
MGFEFIERDLDLPPLGTSWQPTADRGVFSYTLWREAIATNADLLWRVKTSVSGPKPRHVRDLPDGS